VKRSKHASTRERASIVLGSNAGNSAAAIAASWLTDPNSSRHQQRPISTQRADLTG
jgi:hypothetical protein